MAGRADSERQRETLDMAPCRMRLVCNDVYHTGQRLGGNGKTGHGQQPW